MSKWFVFAIILFFTLQGVAMPDGGGLPGIEWRNLGEKRLALHIVDLQGKATIELADAQGEVLLNETIRGVREDYQKVYNLKKLPAGKYAMRIAMPLRQVRQELLITPEGALEIRPEEREVYFLPSMKVGEEYVDLNWFSGEQAEVVVKVQRANGEVVFEEELKEVLLLQRRYNLSELARGNYVIVLQTPYDHHYRRMRLD